MNLIRGQCLVCKQKEQVLKTAEVRPFLKYIINTYFINNKIGVKELKYRISPKSLCVVCACNVETSYKFKKTYEDKVKKETVIKKTRVCCLVCGFRGFGLVKTEDNPNDFEENVRLFMKTISKSRPYKQCVVCFVCVLELQNFNKINAVLQEEIESSNSKIQEIVLSEDEDLKIVPSGKTALKTQNSTPIKSNLRKRKRCDSTSPIEEIPPTKIPKIILSKQYINKNSSVVKSVKTLSKTENIKIPRTVVRDEKMYNNLPYIGLDKVKLDITKREVNTENFNIKPGNRRSKTRNTAAYSFDYQKPKVSIRIKLLSKKRKPCPKSKKKMNRCNECNQVFTTFCQLKSHLLWHEKPEFLQVYLVRDQVISEMTRENQKGKNKNVIEQEKEQMADEEVEEVKEVEVSVDNQELMEEPCSRVVVEATPMEEPSNEVVIDTTPSNDIEDSLETDRIDQEETNSNKEKILEESDKSVTTPDTLESFNEKDEYVVVDELEDETNKNENGEETCTSVQNESEEEDQEEGTSQQNPIGNDTSTNRVEEEGDEEKKNGNEDDKEPNVVEEIEKENKSNEITQTNSEHSNEEYHDANDEINLFLSESDKFSEKSSSSHKQSNKDSSEEEEIHMDQEESEEQTEKSSEDISDEENNKTKAIENKLRMILGEEDEEVPLNNKNKDDLMWDEACSDKRMFDITALNNTILKKSTMKTEESPKMTKKVRFIVDSDIVEEESNVNNDNCSIAKEVEMFENIICHE